MYWNSGQSDVDPNESDFREDDFDDDVEHVLESPLKKVVIRGYTGFRPNQKYVVSKPGIPSEEEQRLAIGIASGQLSSRPSHDSKGSQYQKVQYICGYLAHILFRKIIVHAKIFGSFAD